MKEMKLQSLLTFGHNFVFRIYYRSYRIYNKFLNLTFRVTMEIFIQLFTWLSSKHFSCLYIVYSLHTKDYFSIITEHHTKVALFN